VHFADGQTQQWLMVRLEDPGAQKAPASQPAAAVQKPAATPPPLSSISTPVKP